MLFMKTCQHPGCDKPHDARGYCKTHFMSMREAGLLPRVNRKAGTGSITERGYIKRQVNRKFTLEHILVAEKALGKTLPKGAQVHHIDGNKSNNDPRNLVLCPDIGYHKLLHRRTEALEACGNPNYVRCYLCKEYDEQHNIKVSGKSQYHRECFNAWERKHRASRQ